MRSQKLIQTLYKAGFRGEALKKAWAIAQRESGGRADAYNGNLNTGDQSYGLFQINMLGDMGPARRRQFGLKTNADLLDPTVNARVAFQMSQGGKDFGAWAIGPNAYKGAPANAKDKYLQWLRRYPGDGDAAKAQLQVGGQTFGNGDPRSPQQLTLSDSQVADQAAQMRGVTGNWLLQRAAARRAGHAPALGGLVELGAQRRALQQMFAESPVEAPDQPQRQAPSAVPAAAARIGKGKALQLPTQWEGTHETDNLGWGSKSAEDIMSKAGTPVGAPEDGIVVAWDPQGAQGGGRMRFRAADGREYWIGHIDNGLPAGTRVRRGQIIADVSSDHAAPHVHIDARGGR